VQQTPEWAGIIKQAISIKDLNDSKNPGLFGFVKKVWRINIELIIQACLLLFI
jgi:hypothetical protein